MQQKHYIFIGILILALAAGIFSYPKYFNQGVDFVNSRLSWTLPHFPEKDFTLGLDLQGGVQLVYQADLSTSADKSGDMARLRDLIERRVNIFGVSEPVVQIQGQDRLLVELPGVSDVNQAIDMIGQTPYLEFDEQRTEEETNQILDKIKEVQDAQEKGEDFSKITDWQLALQQPYFKPTELTGKYLQADGTRVNFDQINRPIVELQFNDEGAKVFEEITERNIGKKLAIFLDGNSIVDNTGDGKIDAQDFYNPYAPVVQAEISGGKAEITGNMTRDQANKLAGSLKAGALPVKIGTPISQKTVGPTLGEISLRQSFMAAIIGFLAILLFLAVFYRLSGLTASLTLLFYVAIMLSVIKLFAITITLSGIAGILLSMGMAVDANILIFSRIREELKSGKGLAQSIADGTKRAWPSIRDGNLTTILVGLVLFFFGTSFVKGFALTLVIGNLVGMFTAILMTNFLLGYFSSKTKKLIRLWI